MISVGISQYQLPTAVSVTMKQNGLKIAKTDRSTGISQMFAARYFNKLYVFTLVVLPISLFQTERNSYTEKYIPSNVEGKPSLPLFPQTFPLISLVSLKISEYRFPHPRSEEKLSQNEGIRSYAFPRTSGTAQVYQHV
jgi:hypothetical protein